MGTADGTTVWTVGHSNLTLAGFLGILRAHDLAQIVDVRRFPGSRRHPHFSRGPLSEALGRAGIAYAHLEPLGGHREPRPDSPHSALAEPAFRAYADHMGTPAFAEALRRLVELARTVPTAVLCAEKRREHCHRSLLADRLVVGGHRVVHVVDADETEEHVLHDAAQCVEGGILYRGARQLGFEGW